MATSVRSNEIAETATATAAELDRKSLEKTCRFEFLDLKAQFATIREEIMEAVTRVIESQHFILGNEVTLLEQEIATMVGAKHAVGCASGSDALVLAMMACEIQPGDEVITTPFTFFATGGSIARVGAKPVFVDIDAETFNINPNNLEEAITPRTRAILPVHLFGLAADLDRILNIAEARGLAVIEDAAQAIGARYKGRFVGTLGTFGCFSFFPSKNLGGAGDGGLITTNDDGLAEKLRLLRVHGSKKKYHHELLGINSRLDALQAAILRVKLRHVEKWTQEREARADGYRLLFKGIKAAQFAQLPQSPPAELRHVYNQFSVRCQERDELRQFLQGRGIPTEIYYPIPLHLQKAFSYLGYRAGQFPQAEKASAEVLALPVYPELKESQQRAIVQAIADFYYDKD